MPTGYTADIEKGITFSQFVWGCARGFGALVTMRDDPADAPVPARFEPSDYHAKALAKANAALERLKNLTEDQAEEEAEQEHMLECLRYEELISSRAALRVKYESMLSQARKWSVPSPDHVELKAFMIEQIMQSIDWDCKTDLHNAPDRPQFSAWYAQKIADAYASITYHSKHHEEEIKRTETRNLWIHQLRVSLGEVTE